MIVYGYSAYYGLGGFFALLLILALIWALFDWFQWADYNNRLDAYYAAKDAEARAAGRIPSRPVSPAPIAPAPYITPPIIPMPIYDPLYGMYGGYLGSPVVVTDTIIDPCPTIVDTSVCYDTGSTYYDSGSSYDGGSSYDSGSSWGD